MSIVKQSLVGASGQGGDYTITDSLRFRSAAEAQLYRTFCTPTDNNKWTYSVWVKRGVLSSGYNTLFGRYLGASNFIRADFLSDKFRVYQYVSATQILVETTAVFRDPSAWYHLTIVMDTSNATSTDRVIFYVNGVRVTAFSSTTYPSLNLATNWNVSGGVVHRIGALTTGDFDGYLTEANFIDGQALTADDFGEFDEDTGVWKPKRYTGTYGNNGFYIDATTSGTAVLDQSGNSNNWSASNMNFTTSSATTYDLMKDTPSLVDEDAGNFATLNPLDAYPGRQFAVDANLKWNDTSGGSWGRSTISVTTGKWYWEVSGFTTTNWFIGVSDGTKSITNYYAYYVGAPTALVYLINGNTYIAGANAAFISPIATTAVVGFVVDADAGSLAVYKNGALQGTITGLNYGSYSPMVAPPAVGSCVYNFGQRPFAYTPPTGSKKLNTFNLTDSTIEDGSDYFNTVLYTGANPNAAQSITGVGFQPDFLWIKSRVTGYGHALQDVLRGATGRLQSNTTGAESVSSTYVSSFDSDGFSLGVDYGQNAPNEPYVAWSWKASNTTATNSAGTNGATIASTYSANTTSGFSISTHEAQAGTYSFYHGLGVAPSMFVFKNMDAASNWTLWQNDIASAPTNKIIYLNTTDAVGASGSNWLQSVTSNVIQLTAGQVHSTSGTYVTYAFAEVPGYSAFGSYTGNGSADGPFIYTGFRPAWVLFKRIDNSFGADWIILDTSRDTYNSMLNRLNPNGANAENATLANLVDYTSNGFKIRSTLTGMNVSGGTIIYMAFAENPFKNALAR